MCSLTSTLRYCCVGPAPFDDIGDIHYHESASSSRTRQRSSSPEVPVLHTWVRHSSMTDNRGNHTTLGELISEENRKGSSTVDTISRSSLPVQVSNTTGAQPVAHIMATVRDNSNGNAIHGDPHTDVNRQRRDDNKPNTTSDINKLIGDAIEADGNLNNNVSHNEYGNGINQSRDKNRDNNRHLHILRNDTRADLRSGAILTAEGTDNSTGRGIGGTRDSKNHDISLRNLLERHIPDTESDIRARCYPSRRSNRESSLMSKMAGCVQLKYPNSPVEFYPLKTLTPSPPFGPPRPAWGDS